MLDAHDSWVNGTCNTSVWFSHGIHQKLVIDTPIHSKTEMYKL